MTDERTVSMFAEAPPEPRAKAYMPFPPSLAPHANEVDRSAPAVREIERKTDEGVAVTRAIDGQYLVERVRDNGTTYAGMFCTRAELEQLVAAGTEALQ